MGVAVKKTAEILLILFYFAGRKGLLYEIKRYRGPFFQIFCEEYLYIRCYVYKDSFYILMLKYTIIQCEQPPQESGGMATKRLKLSGKYWSIHMKQEVVMNKEIGRRIRAVRKKHGLSQEKMAEILGIHSTTHYQNIEYGKSKVTINHSKRIYEKFGATPNYILLGKVANEEEYVYDFQCQTDEEKVKVFVEIAKQAFGGPQYDYDVYLKKKQKNVLKGEDIQYAIIR